MDFIVYASPLLFLLVCLPHPGIFEQTIVNSRAVCYYYIQMIRMDEFCGPEKENSLHYPRHINFGRCLLHLFESCVYLISDSVFQLANCD